MLFQWKTLFFVSISKISAVVDQNSAIIPHKSLYKRLVCLQEDVQKGILVWSTAVSLDGEHVELESILHITLGNAILVSVSGDFFHFSI